MWQIISASFKCNLSDITILFCLLLLKSFSSSMHMFAVHRILDFKIYYCLVRTFIMPPSVSLEWGLFISISWYFFMMQAGSEENKIGNYFRRIVIVCFCRTVVVYFIIFLFVALLVVIELGCVFPIIWNDFTFKLGYGSCWMSIDRFFLFYDEFYLTPS